MSDSANERDRKFQPKITPPRDDYFMGLLLIAAAGCRDPLGQQAAFIVDNKDRWISFGINFLAQPEGYQAKKFGWEPESRDLAMITAGEAAIDRALKIYVPGQGSGDPFLGHTMYISSPPSVRDVRRAASNGLKEIIYGPLRPQLFDEQDWADAQRLADGYSVKVKPFDGNLNWLRDRVWALSHLF